MHISCDHECSLCVDMFHGITCEEISIIVYIIASLDALQCSVMFMTSYYIIHRM